MHYYGGALMKIPMPQRETLDIYFRYLPGTDKQGNPGPITTVATIQAYDTKELIACEKVTTHKNDTFVRAEGRRLALLKALHRGGFNREEKIAIFDVLKQRKMHIASKRR
jgi:hypothetical protein